MNLPQIPLLDLLRQRMSWLNARQTVLSQNIANADTPGYLARDLKPVGFGQMLQQADAPNQFATTLAVTNPRHIQISFSNQSQFHEVDSADTTANPTGNTVSLEDEMIKVANNQAQYQAASNLYAKAMGLLRTAIGQP